MRDIPSLNLKNILGTTGDLVSQCSYTRTSKFDNSTSTFYGTVTSRNGDFVSVTDSGSDLRSYVQNNPDQAANSGWCNFSAETSTFSYRGQVDSVSSSSTGVYEYQDFMAPFAAFAVILVIILRGIYLAKRAARATIEETSDDDAIEWYEDAYGVERWRIKAAVRRRME